MVVGRNTAAAFCSCTPLRMCCVPLLPCRCSSLHRQGAGEAWAPLVCCRSMLWQCPARRASMHPATTCAFCSRPLTAAAASFVPHPQAARARMHMQLHVLLWHAGLFVLLQVAWLVLMAAGAAAGTGSKAAALSVVWCCSCCAAMLVCLWRR